jgi:FkbM family methyltransferase
MTFFSIIKYIVNHPLNQGAKGRAILRFLSWQISIRINPYPIVYNFTKLSKLIVGRGMTGATGNYYCGLHEFSDMGFLLHFLRSEDSFVDIGANIGSYTILASAHIGASSISIEPVKSTFDQLINNILINNIQNKVQSLNVAVGSSQGEINFTSSLDTVNHVATQNEKDFIQVKVDTFDTLLKYPPTPQLSKIDVEGYETEVIRGAQETLLKNELKATIIELNGSGLRYGYNELDIHNNLGAAGFKSYSYGPFNRVIQETERIGGLNTIYLRDIDFVRDRIAKSPFVEILVKNFRQTRY